MKMQVLLIGGFDIARTLAASLSADGGAITLDGSTLELAPFGAAVLTPAAG